MLPVHIVCISRRTILSSDEESDETAEPSYQPPTLPRSGPYRAPPLVSSSPPAPPPPPTANSPPPPPVGLRDPQLQIAPIGSSVHLSPQASTSTSTPRRPLQPTAQPRDSMMVRLLTLLEDIKDTQRVQFRMLQSLVQQRDGTTSRSELLNDARFPLKTVGDVEANEQKLADPIYMKELVCTICLVTDPVLLIFCKM